MKNCKNSEQFDSLEKIHGNNEPLRVSLKENPKFVTLDFDAVNVSLLFLLFISNH